MLNKLSIKYTTLIFFIKKSLSLLYFPFRFFIRDYFSKKKNHNTNTDFVYYFPLLFLCKTMLSKYSNLNSLMESNNMSKNGRGKYARAMSRIRNIYNFRSVLNLVFRGENFQLFFLLLKKFIPRYVKLVLANIFSILCQVILMSL